MPIPFLLIGAAVATGAVGAGKTIKAVVDSSDAKKINENANDIIESAKGKLEISRDNCGTSLERLGKEKALVLNNSMTEFLDSFEKIKNVDFTESAGLDEIKKLHIDKKTFEELREMGNMAASLVGGVASGAVSGALTAFGAYSAATTFAAASTGTAIASLSGAAATNATLAFFGGGSLAAGGMGIAGGTAVLGGLVAGPALLVMGFVTGAKAKTNLENAYSNLAEAKKIAEELETAAVQSNAIRRRTYMFYNLLVRLDAYFLPLIYKMEDIIEKEGTDYTAYTEESKNTIAGAVSIAGTIKAVLDTAILTEDGLLTKESEEMGKTVSAALTEREEEA